MNDKIKVGIIGAGGRGIRSFGRLICKRDDAEVVALCDPNKVRMKAMSELLTGKRNFYSSVTEMIKKEKLQAVIVTSPDCYHEQNAVDALNCGVHALIDKPLATTVKGCRNIIAAAKKSKRTAMIGFNLRHSPILKRLKEIVDSGTLGRIFLIENREFYDGGRTYMSRWNRKYEICGGLWIHKGSHDFDVFNWLLGFPKPVKVSSFAGIDALNPQNIPFKVKRGVPVGPICDKCAYVDICPDKYPIVLSGDDDAKAWDDKTAAVDNYYKNLCIYTSDKNVHDNGIAIVEYENGAKASHLECFVTSLTDRLYTIVGTRGQAEVSLHNLKIVIRPRWSQEVITHDIQKVEGGHGGADPSLVESFMNVVKGNAENLSTCEHGMLSTAIGQAAEISRREGRTVYIDELMKG